MNPYLLCKPSSRFCSFLQSFHPRIATQGQSAHNPDPRYQVFEDRSNYLNAIEIEMKSEIPGIEMQVRRAISQINPDLAVIDSRPFADQVKANFTQQVMIARLVSLLGLLALVLVHRVIRSYSVFSRAAYQ